MRAAFLGGGGGGVVMVVVEVVVVETVELTAQGVLSFEESTDATPVGTHSRGQDQIDSRSSHSQAARNICLVIRVHKYSSIHPFFKTRFLLHSGMQGSAAGYMKAG